VSDSRDVADHVEIDHERELAPGADPAAVHAEMHLDRTDWDHAHASPAAAPRLTPARRAAVAVFAVPGREAARYSNVTDVGSGTVYWQSADWLVASGYAVRKGQELRLTPAGDALVEFVPRRPPTSSGGAYSVTTAGDRERPGRP
jgi:hypothetical protein